MHNKYGKDNNKCPDYQNIPHSLGMAMLHSRLIFGLLDSDEWKVMAMSAFGELKITLLKLNPLIL